MTAETPKTEAEKIAETLGVVLGAASARQHMSEQRLNSMDMKLRQVVAIMATDGADAEAADERFSAEVEAGKVAAETGMIDPENAEVALIEMESQIE
jgi:hypothetical protein